MDGTKSRVLQLVGLVLAFTAVTVVWTTGFLVHRSQSHYGYHAAHIASQHTRTEELLAALQQQQQELTALHQDLRGGLQTLTTQLAATAASLRGASNGTAADAQPRTAPPQQDARQPATALQQQLASLGAQSNQTWHGVQQLLNSYARDKAAVGPTYVTETDLNLVTAAGEPCPVSHGIGLHLPRSAIAPVVILTHNRVRYLARTLMSVLRVWSADPANADRFPLVVSVDGGHQPTLLFVATLKFAYPRLQIIQNIPNPGICRYSGYCNLSWHYKMLLQRFFKCESFQRLIFLEDDLEISPDFFSYFAATVELLAADKSLWCVSAWNDHGQKGRAANSTALYRTDILPGLGWMLERQVGLELLGSWPKGGWDDWMRTAAIRKNRQCVFPEVSRTHTFGNYGTSGGTFYKDHLAPMLLNQEPTNWTAQDLSYLRQANYSSLLSSWISHAQLVTDKRGLAAQCDVRKEPDSAAAAAAVRADLVVGYGDENEYQIIAKALHPMLPDLQAEQLPRASCNGSVMVRCQGQRLFIVPSRALPDKV